MLCGLRRSWRQRRNYKLWLIWIALASLGAVVPFALSSLKALGLQGLDPQSAVKAVESWKGWRELLFQGPQPSSFEDWLNGHPNISVALAGFLFIGLPLTTMRASLHDRFFASFNDDVLRPVLSLRKPNPDQNDASHIVWLPWVLGKTGARRVAWDTLKAWVNGVAAPASINAPIATSRRRSSASPWTAVRGDASSQESAPGLLTSRLRDAGALIATRAYAPVEGHCRRVV